MLDFKLGSTDNFLSTKDKTTDKSNDKTIDKLSDKTIDKTDLFGVSNIPNHIKFDMEDLISVTKLEKGLRTIFVPHSQGVYVSISLNKSDEFDDMDSDNKFFQCKVILELDTLESKIKELLM